MFISDTKFIYILKVSFYPCSKKWLTKKCSFLKKSIIGAVDKRGQFEDNYLTRGIVKKEV